MRSILKLIQLAYRIKRKARLLLFPGSEPAKVCQGAIRKLLGTELLHAVDIGGAVDLQPHWYKILGSTHYHIFEPHPASCEELRAKYGRMPEAARFHIYQRALSRAGGSRTLYLTNAPTGSTIVPFNPKSPYFHESDSYFFPMKEQEIDTVSLETALGAESVGDVDLIKLDVQGAELEILEGLGPSRIGTLLCIEMEVHLNNLYSTGTSLDQVYSFFCKTGFELFDVKVGRSYIQRNGRTDTLLSRLQVGEWSPEVSAKAWEFDLVAFLRPDQLLASGNRTALRKLIALYCTYNFFLEAYGLADEARSQGIFTQEECGSIQEAVDSMRVSLGHDLEGYKAMASGWNGYSWGQYLWLKRPSS